MSFLYGIGKPSGNLFFYYCPDMHSTNKAILIELLNLTEPKPEKDSKMVELKRKTG